MWVCPPAHALHHRSEVVFHAQSKEKPIAVREVKAAQIGSLVRIKVRGRDAMRPTPLRPQRQRHRR